MILDAGGGNHRHKVDVFLSEVAVSLLVVMLLLQPECKWFAAFDDGDDDDDEDDEDDDHGGVGGVGGGDGGGGLL